MKQLSKILLTIALVVAVVAGLGAAIYQGSFAEAATSNPSPGSTGYQIAVMPISAITTTTTAIRKFKVPWPVHVVTFSATANAITGVVTLDLKNQAQTSLLSSAMTLSTTANVVTEATLTTSSSTLTVADETTLQINTAGTGTANDVTILLGIKRL